MMKSSAYSTFDRRRKGPRVERDSTSAEASEESNAETDANLVDDDDSASMTDLSRKSSESFDGVAFGRPSQTSAAGNAAGSRRSSRTPIGVPSMRTVPERAIDEERINEGSESSTTCKCLASIDAPLQADVYDTAEM